MRKLLTITALVLFIALASPMWAQVNDVYQVSFFDAPWSAVAWVSIINPGEQGTPISRNQGTVCADIYVFDSNQEMLECCACPITANGMIRLVVQSNVSLGPSDLLNSTLTTVVPDSGVIKIVSDAGSNCNPANPIPTPDLRAWTTGYAVTLGFSNAPPLTFAGARNEFQQAPLQADEQGFLGQACSFVLYLGSGRGQCNCGGPQKATH